MLKIMSSVYSLIVLGKTSRIMLYSTRNILSFLLKAFSLLTLDVMLGVGFFIRCSFAT